MQYENGTRCDIAVDMLAPFYSCLASWASRAAGWTTIIIIWCSTLYVTSHNSQAYLMHS